MQLDDIFNSIIHKKYNEINIDTDLTKIILRVVEEIYQDIFDRIFISYQSICSYFHYDENSCFTLIKTSDNIYYLFLHRCFTDNRKTYEIFNLNTKQIIYFYKHCLLQMSGYPIVIDFTELSDIN